MRSGGGKKTGISALFFAALGVALTVAGCGGQETQADRGREKEKLTLWSYYETDAQTEALDELVEGFNLSQSDYELSWKYVPMTEFTKKLTMAYTEQSLPDLALIDNPDMPACIKMGMFEDITDFLGEMGLTENYYPALLRTVTYEGRMYGLPFNCNNVALIYNREMLKEKGIEPPGTWEELEEAAGALTEEGRSGFLMSAMEGEQGAFQILPWILSTGEGTDDIGGEGTKKAFEFIHGLVEQGFMARDCINYSQTDVAQIFTEGGAAMMENGPWVFPLLKERGVDYGVSPLPVDQKSSVIVGGENLGILKGKNLEGAKAVLAYCDRDGVMGKFCGKTCVLPTKKGIGQGEDTGMEVFREQMEGAVVRTDIPFWNTMSGELSRAVYRMASGERTAGEEAAALKTQE